VLKHINWSIQWEATFKAGTNGALTGTPVPSKTKAAMTNPHDGGPPKLMAAIAGAAGASANEVARISQETCYARWQDLANLRPLPPAPAPPRPRPRTDGR